MNKEKQIKLKQESNFNQLLIKIRRLEEQNRILKAKISIFEAHINSQSAKPDQANIPASPCPADINSPGRHPGDKDCELRKHKLSEKV